MTIRTRLFLSRYWIASVMALALASAAFAQPMEGAPMAMLRGFGGMHGDRLRHLGLTEAQQDQIFKLHHDQAPEIRERIKAARRAHGELMRSAKATPFDRERARQLADAEAKAVAQLAFMRVETMSRVRAVLTDEQRVKLDARQAGEHGRQSTGDR